MTNVHNNMNGEKAVRSTGVLDGVRVVELTTMITGPVAGSLLGDMGADIVKVENRDGGDPFRAFRGGDYSAYFTSYNRNKRSITLDLRAPEAREICLKLIAQADVLIENFRPGVMDRLGLDDAILAQTNPSLIHAAITGFGNSGPYRDRPCYDTVAQSLSGMMAQFVDPEMPQPTGPTLSDNISGFYAACGILGALYERAKTGKGRRVDVNMLESSLAFTADALLNNKRYDIPIGPLTRVAASQSFSFRCSDHCAIAIHLSSQTKFWEALLLATNRQDLATDPRFETIKGRIANYIALRDSFAPTFAQRERAYWAKRLTEEDVPFAPVLRPEEVPDDPQAHHLGSVESYEHPVHGEIWNVRTPLRFDGLRPEMRMMPPMLSEHTDEILQDLGYGSDDIARLRNHQLV